MVLYQCGFSLTEQGNDCVSETRRAECQEVDICLGLQM
jgi:hypothetical protein